jgi:hypothetical protein
MQSVMEERVEVRHDYAAFLRAKVTPGVRYEGDFAILPRWDRASEDIANALAEHAPHLHDYQRFAVTFAVAWAALGSSNRKGVPYGNDN